MVEDRLDDCSTGAERGRQRKAARMTPALSKPDEVAHPAYCRTTQEVVTLADMVTAFAAVREAKCAHTVPPVDDAGWQCTDGISREIGRSSCARGRREPASRHCLNGAPAKTSRDRHAHMLHGARWCRAALLSIVSFAFLLPSSGEPVPPPSNLLVSHFQYTSLNASWEGPTAGPSGASSYDLRWRPMGAQGWVGGREVKAPGLSYEITGLVADTQYEFNLQARNSQGDYSMAIRAVAETLSDYRATNVRAVGITEREVSLAWEPAQVGNAQVQQVFVSADNGNTWQYNAIADEGPMLPPHSGSLNVPFLMPMAPYLFRVDSIFLGYQGVSPSMASQVITTLPAPPQTVVGLRINNLQPTSATLSWEPLVGTGQTGATSVIYLINLAESSAPAETRDSYIVRDSSSLQVSQLLRNTAYFFSVVARNNKGKLSAPSERGVFTTLAALPAQMPPPTLRRTTYGLLLTWNPPVTNLATGGLPIDSFTFYTKREDEVGFDSGLNIGNVLSYEVLNLTANFRYEFAVSAVNAVGTGARGEGTEKAMPPEPPAMQAPTLRVIDDGQTSVIEVSWIPPELAKNVVNYRVFLRQVVPFTVMDSGTVVAATERKFRFENLPDGTRFEVKVAAETSLGLSNISAASFIETRSDTIPTGVRGAVDVTGTTTCELNVTWTKPRLPVSEFRVFYTIFSIDGAEAVLTGSQRSFFVLPSCIRGALYTFYVQAVFNGGSGEILSLDSNVVDVPVSPPSQMSAPRAVTNPSDPSTSIIVSWEPPVIINPVPKSIITEFILTIGHPQALDQAQSQRTLIIPAPATSYTLTDLYKKTFYTFRIQAVNSLGPSEESPLSSVTTDFTVPAPVVNITVIPGSESPQGEFLTLSWDISDWGESDETGVDANPFPYPYCNTDFPPQTPCDGRRYFLATPYRVGDDYREPTYIFGNNFQYQFTGLSGGIDYTFVVVAVNTNGLQSGKGIPLRYRTVSVVPRAITSLNVFTPADPDLGSRYKIGLEWTIPIDAETTGGMTLTGFALRYAHMTQCSSGCADASAACTDQRSNPPWVDLPNVGAVASYQYLGLKGATYVFSIAGINGIGRGVFWPDCSITDLNCAGVPNGQIPYTCHSAVFTVPTPVANFGDWGDDQPGVQPYTSEGFEIRWGGGTPEYFDYADPSFNGGRPIEMVEIQRAELSTMHWPIDHYCPTLPEAAEGELPICLWKTGCTPEPCIAACPICVDSQFSETDFNLKRKLFQPQEETSLLETYVFRIRFSNVLMNDCANRPPSLGSSPMCDWSEFSEVAQVQITKPEQYHNLFTRVNSPTSVQILWFVPGNVLQEGVTPATFGDFVNIWYGPTVASVSVSPFSEGNWTRGPSRGNTWQQFEVTQLVPATTYYFTVVSYYSSDDAEIQSTRSAVTKAVVTAVGIPARVTNVTTATPISAADVQAGGLTIGWIQVSTLCVKGTGLFLEDGSVDSCPRGEKMSLAAYRISWRKEDGDPNAWVSLTVSSSLNSYTVTGLEKEIKYLIKVSAINSQHEGMASVEVQGTPIATIPGSPPPPLSTGASVSSVRVAWEEPDDLGTKQVIETKFRLTIYPRRDGKPGNETVTFTWEREYVVTGLRPNSLYLFSVAYQATPMLGFGFSSKTSWVFTTPLPPVNLQLSDGKNITESTTVLIRWQWSGVVQGNVTITGYRLSFFSVDGTSEGETFCSGGSPPVDGVPGAVTNCVLAGMENGKLYTITISASNDPRLETSFGPVSTPMMLQTKPALPTVVNIGFVDTGAYSTKIEWTTYDGGLAIEGYSLRIKRESDDLEAGNVMTGVASAPGDGGIRSSFLVTGLGANLYYRFVIVATNALGFRPSELSSQIRTRPAAVAVPTLVLLSSFEVKISWPVWYGKNPLDEYSIQARLNINAGNIGSWFVSGTVRGQEFTLPSLMANTGYDIRVAAMNNAGIGSYGEILNLKTQAAPPRFVYVTRIGAGDCDLRWNPQPGATPYYTVIPTRLIPESSTWLEEASRTKTEGQINFFHVSGLVKGATYRFQVATSSALGTGARSEFSHEVTTLSSLPEPGPKPSLSDPSVAGLIVTWTAVETNDGNGGSPATAYVLYSYAHMYQGGGWQEAVRLFPDADTGIIPTRYVAAGLLPDVNYQFKVALVNENGVGPTGPASEKMPTVPGALEAPFQQAFLKTILLTWTPPENNSFTAYRIYFSEFGDDPNGLAETEEDLWAPYVVQIVPSSTTSMKYDSLKPDYPYRFKMAARNPSGWGADSPVVYSRTTIVADPWAMDNGQVAMMISSPTILTTSAQLTWLGPAAFDPNQRGSSIGFRIIACQAVTLICDAGEAYLEYCEEDPPNIYTRSHECDISKYQYNRQGLLKNTLYYFQLSIVNSGGEGPRSKASPEFRTKADYPVQMARPTATTLSLDSISVSWDRMVDWNSRGGLDVTGYVLFKQAAGFSYDEGEVVYEGVSFTYSNLPSNTKFYFAVIAENTWCTLCRTDIIVPEGTCFFEACCDTHTCSPKSPNSLAVSTKTGKMTLPRLEGASIYDIIVTWDVVPGTPDNIFAYKIRFRDIDRADKDDAGGWVERIFSGTQAGVAVKNYPLVNLDPNNRYEVILNADNGFGYGDPSDSAILMTKANRVQFIEVVAARATEVTLRWEPPPGRSANIIGYSISYRPATNTEIILKQQSETLPLEFVTTVSSATRFDVINLRANTTYIFSVAPINGGGVGEYSAFTPPYKTMALDLLGSCYFYPASDDGHSVLGSFILQQKASGTATLQGMIRGLAPSEMYSLMSWQYGKTSTDNHGTTQTMTTFTASLQGEHALVALETSLVLQGPASSIASSFRLFRGSDSALLSQCELGLAKPRSGADENGAVPALHKRAFCTLVPLSGVQLSGGFIASPTDLGIRVRGRVCGVSDVASSFSVRLHEFGDIQTGNYNDVGRSLSHMGTMYIDNLESANFDLIDATNIGFRQGADISNIMGRSIVLYDSIYPTSENPDPAATALAACVIGAYEPSIDTTVYQVQALPPTCTPCTWLMGLQESMHTVAELFRTDWISVWSLNKANNPDRDSAGTSVYYAHPYVMQEGETMSSVRHRFGITEEHIGLLNSDRTEFLPGEIMCVVPMWPKAVDWNGHYVCAANSSDV